VPTSNAGHGCPSAYAALGHVVLLRRFGYAQLDDILEHRLALLLAVRAPLLRHHLHLPAASGLLRSVRSFRSRCGWSDDGQEHLLPTCGVVVRRAPDQWAV